MKVRLLEWSLLFSLIIWAGAHSSVKGSHFGFHSASSLPKSTSALSTKMGPPGFASALNLSQDNFTFPSSSPDVPAEQDLTSWFASTDIPTRGLMFTSARDLALTPPHIDNPQDDEDDWLTAAPPPGVVMGFQTAKDLHSDVNDNNQVQASTSVASFAGFVSGAAVLKENVGGTTDVDIIHDGQEDSAPAFVGFQTGSSLLNPDNGMKKSAWSAPSAEALAKAAERMKRWQAEIDKEFAKESTQETELPEGHEPSRRPASGRIVLGSVENSGRPSASQPLSQPDPPDTPSPVRTEYKGAGATIGSSLNNRKPFKSPLMNKTAGPSSSYIESPLNPNRALTFSSARGASSFMTPLKAAFPSAVAGPSTSVSPTKKALGATPRRVGGSSVKKSTFVTPFKPGMRPGQPGRTHLGATQKTAGSPFAGSSAVIEITATPSRDDKGKGRAVFFDLSTCLFFFPNSPQQIC